MNVNIDLILAIVLILFTLNGFSSGFVRTAGNLVGLVLGLFAASFFLTYISKYAAVPGHTILSISLFIALAALVSYWVGWIIGLISDVLGIIVFIPFASTINRILGGIVGFMEGTLVVAAVLFYSGWYLTPGPLRDKIADAKMHMFLGWLENLFMNVFLK